MHSAVCEGYAKAFSYLCEKAGLQTELVYGTARNENHEELHACTSSLYMEGNRERTIIPYLEEPYTIVSTDEESFEAAARYLTEHTDNFQIVFDTVPENAESKMALVMEQVKELMERFHIYGQISVEVQYGIADYAIVTVTITQ